MFQEMQVEFPKSINASADTCDTGNEEEEKRATRQKICLTEKRKIW